MELRKGNMFDEVPDEAIFFTANGHIRNDGALTMGAGAALDCKRRHPQLPLRFAHLIRDFAPQGEPYGVVYDFEAMRGAFQVKYHYRDKADLALIGYSAKLLIGVTRLIGRVNVNFPGIGFGGLRRDVVLDVIGPVWSNEDVHVWEL